MKTHEIKAAIHSKRILLMQSYLYLYGAILKNETCKAELFDSDRLPSSGMDDYLHAVMEMEHDEHELSVLTQKYHAEIIKILSVK